MGESERLAVLAVPRRWTSFGVKETSRSLSVEKVDGFLEAKGVKLIQFFGTNEYMWYLEKSDENASSGPPSSRGGNTFRRVDVESFRDGCEKGYR